MKSYQSAYQISSDQASATSGFPISILNGEIPLNVHSLREWKRVSHFEKQINGGMIEFYLEDKLRHRISTRDVYEILSDETQPYRIQYPALSTFIGHLETRLLNRSQLRAKAQQNYKKPTVYKEFIGEFAKSFRRKTNRAIDLMLKQAKTTDKEANSPCIVTFRCRLNPETRAQEFYKMGFSPCFIDLLEVSQDEICYDFLENGIKDIIDQHSLMNLASILISYHFSKKIEHPYFNLNIKTYTQKLINCLCSIKFHAEKMDKSNSYFESLIILKLYPIQPIPTTTLQNDHIKYVSESMSVSEDTTKSASNMEVETQISEEKTPLLRQTRSSICGMHHNSKNITSPQSTQSSATTLMIDSQINLDHSSS